MGYDVVSAILIGAGSLAWLVAILVVVQRVRFYTRGLTGTGRIVGEAVSSTGPARQKHDTMHAPEVEVMDVTTGRPFRFRSSLSTTATHVTIGAEVPVRYRPGQPDQAEIDRPFAMWFFPVGAAVIGTILLAVWWTAPR